MRWYWRLILSIGVALAAATISAMVIVVMDLYLVGHSRPSLNEPNSFVPGTDVPISLSSVLFIIGTVVPALATWLLLGPRRRATGP